MPSFGGDYTVAASVDTLVSVGQGGLSGVLLGNESGLSIVVKMGGNYSRSLYPGSIDWFPIPPAQFSGTITLSPSAMLSNVSSWPSSFVRVDKYGSGEHPTGTYPAPLVRATNNGNVVSTVGGGSNFVQNDANTAGTSIVEATVSGDSASAVSLTNDGVLKIGTAAHHGSVSLDNGTITSDGSGDLTVASLLPTGHIIMPNNVGIQAKDSGGTARDILAMDSGNKTNITAVAGGVVQIKDGSGNVIAAFIDGNAQQTVDGAGASMTTGRVYFSIGTIKAVNTGTGLSGTFNHGLSGTPAAILCVCDSASSSATVGAYSYTTTQFGMTIGGALDGRWWGYR